MPMSEIRRSALVLFNQMDAEDKTVFLQQVMATANDKAGVLLKATDAVPVCEDTLTTGMIGFQLNKLRLWNIP